MRELVACASRRRRVQRIARAQCGLDISNTQCRASHLIFNASARVARGGEHGGVTFELARAVATSCLSKMTCTRVSAQLEREMYQLTDDTSRAPKKTRAQEDNAESFHDECIPTENESEEEDSLDGSEYDW